jgi:hypothetical protein
MLLFAVRSKVTSSAFRTHLVTASTAGERIEPKAGTGRVSIKMTRISTPDTK